MIAMKVKYTIDKELDYGKIVPNLTRRMFVNMKIVGEFTERKIRKLMMSGKYEKNTSPRAAAKDSDRSLYHTGHLSTKIKNRVFPGSGNYFVRVSVGWFTNSNHPGRERGSGGLQTIVNWLTEKQTWQPTDAQRRAFWAQVPAEWKLNNPPIHKPTWESPARDFMTEVATDPQVHALFLKMIVKSTEEIFKGKR